MVEVVLDASRRRHWTDSLNQFERTDQLKEEKEGPPFTALTHIPAGISTAISVLTDYDHGQLVIPSAHSLFDSSHSSVFTVLGFLPHPQKWRSRPWR
ncbi:hypothetical protein RU639_007252 [Aspergillus parasiticus]